MIKEAEISYIRPTVFRTPVRNTAIIRRMDVYVSFPSFSVMS